MWKFLSDLVNPIFVRDTFEYSKDQISMMTIVSVYPVIKKKANLAASSSQNAENKRRVTVGEKVN